LDSAPRILANTLPPGLLGSAAAASAPAAVPAGAGASDSAVVCGVDSVFFERQNAMDHSVPRETNQSCGDNHSSLTDVAQTARVSHIKSSYEDRQPANSAQAVSLAPAERSSKPMPATVCGVVSRFNLNDFPHHEPILPISDPDGLAWFGESKVLSGGQTDLEQPKTWMFIHEYRQR
jgi:hypothetical protein